MKLGLKTLTAANQVKAHGPSAGPSEGVPGILEAIEKFRVERNVPQRQLIQAYGYDDTVMPDGRLLNRDDLDRAFPDNPVLVGHVSMQGGVMDSAALKMFGISPGTRTPRGGTIVRKPGTHRSLAAFGFPPGSHVMALRGLRSPGANARLRPESERGSSRGGPAT